MEHTVRCINSTPLKVERGVIKDTLKISNSGKPNEKYQ